MTIPEARKTMKRKGFIAIIAIIVLISAALSLHPKRKYSTSSDQAYNYFIAGMEAAERLYNTEALDDFESAVKLDSNFASAWAYLSKYYYVQGRIEEAKLAAKQAYKLAQDLPERERLNISLLTAEFRGDDDQFEGILELMLERYPDEIEPHIYRANSLWKNGKLQEAIDEYNVILKLNPNHALTYNSLGYLYAQIGDFQKAIEYLKKYVFIASDQANPHDSIGEIYLMVGRYRDALKHFQSAIAVKPNITAEPNNLGCMIYLHMAKAYRHIVKLKEARLYLNKAREISTGDWHQQAIRLQEGYIFLVQKKFPQALETFKKIYDEAECCNADFEIPLALVYQNLDQPQNIRLMIEKTKKAFAKTLTKNGTNVSEVTDELMAKSAGDNRDTQHIYLAILYLRGIERYASKDWKTAHHYFQTIINGDFYYAEKIFARYLDAEVYYDEGAYSETCQQLQSLLKINPSFAGSILLQAKAQKASKDFSAAQATLERFSMIFYDADDDWMTRREAEELLNEIKTTAMTP